MRDDLYFKLNRTNGELYIQIWKRVKGGKDEFLKSCGSARKLYGILVKAEELEKQTKNLKEIKTKISELTGNDSDQ